MSLGQVLCLSTLCMLCTLCYPASQHMTPHSTGLQAADSHPARQNWAAMLAGYTAAAAAS